MINGTTQSSSVILNGQNHLNVRIEGFTDTDMSYDVMVIIKNDNEMPYATYAPGHYYGNIKHTKAGVFNFDVDIELPKILAKGNLKIDLFIHHPMIEYLMKAENCCSLMSDGFQEGFGRTLEHGQNGFMGLETFNIKE